MYTYIFLFTLLTLSSVAVSAGLLKVLNVAKFLADIHQELTNSRVNIMKLDGENQDENNFDFFPARFMRFGKKYSLILCHQSLQV
jgi:hypothetical protein